jgi:hypothetical protein
MTKTYAFRFWSVLLLGQEESLKNELFFLKMNFKNNDDMARNQNLSCPYKQKPQYKNGLRIVSLINVAIVIYPSKDFKFKHAQNTDRKIGEKLSFNQTYRNYRL